MTTAAGVEVAVAMKEQKGMNEWKIRQYFPKTASEIDTHFPFSFFLPPIFFKRHKLKRWRWRRWGRWMSKRE